MLMIDLHVHDPWNHVFLAGYYLPKQAVFRRAIEPDASSGHDPWARLPDEVGTGQLLRYAVRKTLEAEHPQFAGTHPEELGIETWVVGRDVEGSGRLAAWFTNQRAGYRVWIHRTPHSHHGQTLGPLWYKAYEYVRSHRIFDARPGVAAPDALRQGVRVLEDALAAYRGGPEAVRSFFDQIDHPCRQIRHEASP